MVCLNNLETSAGTYIKHALEPLKNLLSKKNEWLWNEDHSKAKRLVKDIITGPQCLARFDPRKPIVLITDASRIGLGFVLVHPEVDDLVLNKDGYLITTSPTSYTIKKHPKGWLITCGSRFISATELNYAVVELEMWH